MPELRDRLQEGLAGRYRLERELGRGGMAMVFLARDLKHDRQVALKVLRPELAAVLGRERFLAEIRLTAKLDHPHILTLIDSGEVLVEHDDSEGGAGGAPRSFLYYVLPYIRGESLRQRLDTEKQLPIEETVRIARQVASALDYAHRQGVIHRDIKPENILLHEGEAMLTDFGIALAVQQAGGERLTETGLTLGTPDYMSPEQATSERDLTPRSDLFSLGAVVYEMLSGEPPFRGRTPQAAIARLMTERPPALRTVRDTVPVGLEAAVLKALAKVPADRFSTVGEFAAALARPETSHPAGRPRVMIGTMAGCVLIAATWFALRGRGAASGRQDAEPPRSIAVLPFLNMRGDSTGDYFSDGVTEEILYALTQLPDLRVAARTSAFQFKGKEGDVRDVGHQLGVEAVLEGSIQREGEAVRITVQLIDARSGYHLWSGKFDRAIADLFAVEDEISRTIADTLKLSLGLAAQGRRTAADAGAHDLYLRGLSRLAQRGASLSESIELFESALASDSTFAPAWAGLAAANELLPAYYLSSYAEALPKAERTARRALALDSTFGPAHRVLANVYRDRLQWADAERSYHRALSLAPNDPETVEQYGQFLFWSGQLERAVRWLERARRLDPLAPIPAATCGTALLFVHQYDSAATMFRLASALAPSLPLPYMWRMWTELDAKRYDSAQVTARRGAQAARRDFQEYTALIGGVADPARRREALTLLQSIPDSAAWNLNGAYRMNWLILLGDTAAALRAVEAVKTHPTLFSVLNLWNPALDPIRKHPRFRSTLEHLGLPFHGTEP